MKNTAVKVNVDVKTSNELVVLHEPLVKRIAYHLMSRLPASVQADDLVQAGMIGLIEASRKFDPEQGASFETYAGIRIRGAMLDEIRRTDWTPRSVHRKAREVAEAVRKIENEKGRDARDVEVAKVMGLELNEYHKILQDATGCRIFSYEDPGTLGEENFAQQLRQPNQPLENLQKSDFKVGLADAIKGLPERERLVMALYYDEELNLREIGDILGVSESRVCQIHGQALIRLRARMSDWLAD
ncbi:MAG: RNA polymerase sigma factor FliA [Gammaproteobacteria bacterium]|nr:RNA polymerase sigma factor FliA [Gammaproteobacteria bacterium]MDH3971417.1 RNA polymerase sigma factor FliA [Gammaproteobacteria bacterium]MDH3985584.1 RNA polymerase sigma factor FliA [Gammaproteobacteria bacterium]